jgi:hypothetical protein
MFSTRDSRSRAAWKIDRLASLTITLILMSRCERSFARRQVFAHAKAGATAAR